MQEMPAVDWDLYYLNNKYGYRSLESISCYSSSDKSGKTICYFRPVVTLNSKVVKNSLKNRE